jgi:hypothetical protein
MAWPSRRNPVRTPIRRWASQLPDDLVILFVLLLGLLLVSLLTVPLALILMQCLRLAGGNEIGIRIVLGIIVVLVVVLICPIIIVFSYIVDILEGLVGTLCPNCRQRELEWRSGSWKYGDPPDYQYFECANCGARFRQLCGGQGVLSELEKVE